MKRLIFARESRMAAALVLCGLLPGCLSPVAMHRAVLEYDHTVSQVESEMLLLNIARARQGLPVHFTAVSNVAATFDFRTNAGVGAQLFDGSGTDITRNFYTLNLGASVAENPTVSIVPIQGEEFTRRILTPMDETKFEFLISQGIEPAIVLRLMARGIGVEQEGETTFFLNLPHRPEEYTEFRRRVLHLSALNLARHLHVGPLEHEEPWPLPPDHPLTAQALDKGYRWITSEADGKPILSKRVVGRIAITNYDPSKLPDQERRRLHKMASRHPRNDVLVDIRPGFPGGEYPWHGQIKLRSFSAILGFVARGIAEEPEFAVDQDRRTGPVLRNPVSTLQIVETTTRPRHAAFAVELHARWYSVGGDEGGEERMRTWNREAFSLLQQLFQMTVTDVARIPTLPITIAK